MIVMIIKATQYTNCLNCEEFLLISVNLVYLNIIIIPMFLCIREKFYSRQTNLSINNYTLFHAHVIPVRVKFTTIKHP